MNPSSWIALLAQDADWHRWGGAGWGGWTWFWFVPFSAALLIAAAALAGWLIWRATRRPEGVSLDRAREILAERYARGELSGDEYRDRLSGL
jgi:putative membrane protein